MVDKHKNTEKKRTAEKVFSLIGGFLALIISLITLLVVSITDSADFKIILLLISSLIIVVSGFLLNKKTSLAFSLMIIFSIVGLLTNVLIFIFPFIFILIGLFTGIIKGRTIGNFIFSTMKAILVSVLLVFLVVYLGFFQPIISKNSEVNNLFTKMDNLEKDFGMAGTEKEIKYDIYKDYSQKKIDLDTAIKNPPALWLFFPEAYSFIIIKPNFQKMVDTANTVEYMKSRVFPKGYIAKETQDILKEYIETEVIKAVDIPCASDMDCLYLYACVNHQCKPKGGQSSECTYDNECKEGYTCFQNECLRIQCQTNEDCNNNEFCGEDKQCLEKECNKNEDCKDGEYCHPSGYCSEKECNNDSDCGQNEECDKTYWYCDDIVCKSDSDCDEGFYCDEDYLECRKTFSTKEVKNGFTYETMLRDDTTFIWCNRDSEQECPAGLTCVRDPYGDYFCQPECKEDSDCESNYQCTHFAKWEDNKGITATEKGYCEHQDSFRRKYYSKYK